MFWARGSVPAAERLRLVILAGLDWGGVRPGSWRGWKWKNSLQPCRSLLTKLGFQAAPKSSQAAPDPRWRKGGVWQAADSLQLYGGDRSAWCRRRQRATYIGPCLPASKQPSAAGYLRFVGLVSFLWNSCAAAEHAVFCFTQILSRAWWCAPPYPNFRCKAKFPINKILNRFPCKYYLKFYINIIFIFKN